KKIRAEKKKANIYLWGRISSLSIAYLLSKKNIKSVLLERDFLGAGASGRNAGFLTGGSLSYFETLVQKYGEKKALEKWFYTKGNIDLLKKELGLRENSESYLPKGTLTLLRSSDEKYEKAFKLLESHKYPVKKVLSPLKGFKQAYLFEEEAFNNPVETLSLLRKKIESFCEIKEGINVISIE